MIDFLRYTLIIKNVRNDDVELVVDDMSQDDFCGLVDFICSLQLGGDSSD